MTASAAPWTAAERNATGASGLAVTVIQRQAELEALGAEWDHLHYRAESRNPFAASAWPTHWARHFVADGDLHVVVVRAEDELVGVVPLYMDRRACGLVRTLRLLGTGHHVRLLELPQPIVAPGHERKVLREVIPRLHAWPTRWDWLELCLAPEHGWFEPQWIPSRERDRGAFVLHKASRACVVMDLPQPGVALVSALKRNVRESIRRSRHRLTRAGDWRVVLPSPQSSAEVRAAITTLIALHEDRSALAGKVAHGSRFEEQGNREYLLDIAESLSPTGRLRPVLLELGGEPIAGALTLRSNGCIYFSFTGMRSVHWDLGAITAILAAELESAQVDGLAHANFSPGPDVSKLRWNEQLEIHNEFVDVSGAARARLAMRAAWPARALAEIRREGKRHRSES
jgi:CelD/BcsL family acetyltransferase involved in cellulose biosynthesis